MCFIKLFLNIIGIEVFKGDFGSSQQEKEVGE